MAPRRRPYAVRCNTGLTPLLRLGSIDFLVKSLAHALPPHAMDETEAVSIFTVLGAAARDRSRLALALQCTVCACVALALWRMSPALWSASALCSAGALHACWGLLDRARDARTSSGGLRRRVSVCVASAGAGLAVIGVVGVAAAMFTGHGRSPYDACGPHATSSYCEALRHPQRVTRLP